MLDLENRLQKDLQGWPADYVKNATNLTNRTLNNPDFKEDPVAYLVDGSNAQFVLTVTLLRKICSRLSDRCFE